MRLRPLSLAAMIAGLIVGYLFHQDRLSAQTTGINSGAGVVIDASGVLRMNVVPDPDGRLIASRVAAARAALPAEIARPSELRKVSLTRLEKAIAAAVERGETPTDEMKYLAGLTSVKFAFLYPETGDIVLAGPAGGYATDLTGRARSLTDGSAVIELQDVIAALRAFPPTGASTPVIACSIDPTPEGLARMQDYLKSVGTTVTPAMTERLVMGLRESLGNQKVTITGISPKTHLAEVLVEADYRMKLIGIGLETVPADVKIPSYVSATRPGEGSRNALQRWYFTPKYDGVVVTEDRSAMELVGQGVELIGVDEMVKRDGSRVGTGTGESRASKQFTTAFTKEYSKLAERSPIYDQLRNVIDLSIVAAYIQDNDWYGKADWDLGVLADESVMSVETGVAPVEVGTAVNAVWRGSSLMTPIGGGVNIQPRKAIDEEHVKVNDNGSIAAARKAIDKAGIPADRWWWD